MFFRKFPRFSGYSSPSSSTIRSALWENAHPSLAAVGLLLATAGGALLPTSVLSCSPRLPQEGQHQKTVAPRMPTNLLHHGSQNRIQKTSRNMAARKGPRLYKKQSGTQREKKHVLTLTLMLVRRKSACKTSAGSSEILRWLTPLLGPNMDPKMGPRIGSHFHSFF